MARVAVTTTLDATDRVAGPLRDCGLEPVSIPCIAIDPAPPAVLEELRSAAAAADWLVLTSRRSVELLWPDGGMPAVAVAAVGGSTAAAVERAGGSVKLVGTAGAHDLVRRLAPMLAGARVVFPRARAGDPAIAELLASASGEVVAHPAYDTRPLTPPTDPAVDAVVFGSPSAVTGWTTSRTLDGLVIGAMGGTTATALADIGHPPQVTPEEPSFELLAHALAEIIDHRSER